MASTYFSVVTDYGVKEMLNAVKEETKVNIAEFAVGDGNGGECTPSTEQAKLVNEVWRGTVNACYVSGESENLLIAESVVPSDVGGFTIREMGLFDEKGGLVAVCNTPDTQKVKISDGVVHELALSMEIALSNTDGIELVVDPNVIVATKKDILSLQDKIEENKSKLDGIEEGANKTIIDEELSTESTNPVQNAVVAAALKELAEEINKIKEMLPSLAAPTAEDAGKILKINADGNAVWAEDYGSSPQAKYPDFYAQDYDVDVTDRKHIETVYEDGHRAVVDIADGGDITQTLYDAGGVVTAQRKTIFSDNKNHITERKVDVNELGQSDMDS